MRGSAEYTDQWEALGYIWDMVDDVGSKVQVPFIKAKH